MRLCKIQYLGTRIDILFLFKTESYQLEVHVPQRFRTDGRESAEIRAKIPVALEGSHVRDPWRITLPSRYGTSADVCLKFTCNCKLIAGWLSRRTNAPSGRFQQTVAHASMHLTSTNCPQAMGVVLPVCFLPCFERSYRVHSIERVQKGNSPSSFPSLRQIPLRGSRNTVPAVKFHRQYIINP